MHTAMLRSRSSQPPYFGLTRWAQGAAVGEAQCVVSSRGAYIRYPEVLKRIGIDPEEGAPVAEAYLQGKGVEEAARRISDSLLARSGMVFSGTPEDCVSSCRELKGHLAEMGFDHLVIGVPLGPNIPEAIDLLTTEIIPNILN